MMGVQSAAAWFFCDFCLDDHVPADHQVRGIDRRLDLEGIRAALKPFFSSTGRSTIRN
jgi:transposase